MIPVICTAVGDISNAGACSTVVFVVEIAVLVKNLSVVNGNSFAFVSDCTEAYITGNFLSEINNFLALGCDKVIDCRNFLNLFYYLAFVGNKSFTFSVSDNDIFPVSINYIEVK